MHTGGRVCIGCRFGIAVAISWRSTRFAADVRRGCGRNFWYLLQRRLRHGRASSGSLGNKRNRGGKAGKQRVTCAGLSKLRSACDAAAPPRFALFLELLAGPRSGRSRVKRTFCLGLERSLWLRRSRLSNSTRSEHDAAHSRCSESLRTRREPERAEEG